MNRATSKKWINLAIKHAGNHPVTSLGLAVAVFSVFGLVLQSMSQLYSNGMTTAVSLALTAGMAGFVATSLGALPALTVGKLPAKIEDSMLGFAAGMMLAASVFSLIIPGIQAGTAINNSKIFGLALVVLGIGLGVLLMLGLDQFTPHKHETLGEFGPGHQQYGRVWLFVFAIALHNLPEGMAMGVSFSRADMSVGLPLSTAIAIQDIPEGLAVALSLRNAAIRPITAVLVAALSGLLEPIGALLGVTMASGMPAAYPIGLGLAAGAMIFVVSHEVIPETHRNGHQTYATIGLMCGFVTMMVLDTALG
jgi:ZIP family zinc transporter